MAKHDVSFTIPERPLGKVDAEFIVKKDGSPLGRLKLSRGGVEWIPTQSKSDGKISWTKLTELITGRKKNRKKKS